jgi:Asp-tRNA(Asn)/Glu-tRNA(Gln) amidotransferase A subunit family amidase
MSAELAFMSAVDLAQNIREKKVSSLEATENFFERIDLLGFIVLMQRYHRRIHP